MLFPTFEFGLFFLVIFAVAWGFRGCAEWRKILLLAGSWVFYGAWDWRFVALLIASASINWTTAQAIGALAPNRKRTLVLALGVGANLAILALFKYCGFFLEQVSAAVHALGWERDLPLLQIVLPVGISFFTFQGISYLVDVYRREMKPAPFLDVTLLMSFFAHLVAGPIVRASDLIPQFQQPARLGRQSAAVGLLLILWGLFKKSVVANDLAVNLVDPAFLDPSVHGRWDLLAATYGYAVQIYFDFSAYSDMAIGLAALLGYRFPRNFDRPYAARSLRDFWQRWHMSLSSWLRDYLYIPLGGNRGGLLRLCRNLMATMLLGGIWHGASWTYLIWGGLHGGVLSLERVWRALKPPSWPALPKILGVLITFHVVCLGWIFFRAKTFDEALHFLQALASSNPSKLTTAPLLLLMIAGGLLTQALPGNAIDRAGAAVSRLPAVVAGAGLASLMMIIEALAPDGVAPFIYYQF